MTAILKVDTIQDTSGNNIINENANTITIGKSGDTINLASGATAGFGKVLQVVTATDDTQRSTTSTSFVTASNTLSISITPSSASNKVYVVATTSMFSPSGQTAFATIFKDSTNLGTALSGMVQTTGNIWSGCPISILNSPNTTSSITYQLYWRVSGGTGYLNGDAGRASITAFEIAG